MVANPPYSANWDNAERKLKDPRFSEYGKFAPKSKADFAFILHSLYHLKTMAQWQSYYRTACYSCGAVEGHIRKILIEKTILMQSLVYRQIYFLAHLSQLVFSVQKRPHFAIFYLLMPANTLRKAKNQNHLSEQHINAIVEALSKKRENIEKSTQLATLEEVQTNEYNLNIPRYVDTFEAEEVEIDLGRSAGLKLLKAYAEIAQLEAEINEQLNI